MRRQLHSRKRVANGCGNKYTCIKSGLFWPATSEDATGYRDESPARVRNPNHPKHFEPVFRMAEVRSDRRKFVGEFRELESLNID